MPLDCDVRHSSNGALTLGPVAPLSLLPADLHSHGFRSKSGDLSRIMENNTGDVM